ncbi:MAG: signal peptidase I [Lachnospiraceae bacterium]|jgi:signal peptidase I|nr:signal peptidase I [Lachnospiraceae bacterium]MCI8994777.1 signal peptidase I [Lachnospiraceae bacterium]MCI9135254.1 signal peptidase I [Lachnospiraceae bacterium]
MSRRGRRGRENALAEEFEEKERTLGQELVSMLLYMAVVLGMTFLVITFLGQRTYVSGDSMKNMLEDGDNLIVDKITYRFRDPQRYDIIVFPFEYKDDTYYIKRIIGMPGETVQVAEGRVYIDGEQLKESYGRELMEQAGIAAEPLTLGEEEYFVLGDNRNASSDSRDPSVGIIHRDKIIGRAWLRIWPLQKFGILKHQ